MIFEPEPRIVTLLRELDPNAMVYRERDYADFGEKFTVTWRSLGLKWTVGRTVSDKVITEVYSVDGLEAMVSDILLNEVVTCIIEAYIEYWHLFYDGDMSLKEFCGFERYSEVARYLDSDGEYLGEISYARSKRLQQRDSRGIGSPERTFRTNLRGSDEYIRTNYPFV